MIAREEVTLGRATEADAVLLSNPQELYIHELSDIFPVDVGTDGRFGYSKLPLYWAEPKRRFAFLIQASGRIAGFAFATRGSPMSDDPEDLDVAEFFVLRSHRRSGVGRHAARLLWHRIPGQWIVLVSEGNSLALAFWESVISEYPRGEFSETQRPGGVHGWRVFSFKTG